jgi:flagellar protein FlaG
MKIQFTDTTATNMRTPDEMSSINKPQERKPLEKMPLENASSQDNTLNRKEVEELAEKIQVCIDRMDINLKFSTYGKKNERTSVAVTEKGTGKEIREIPSKELQQLYLKMNELTGLLFNHTV